MRQRKGGWGWCREGAVRQRKGRGVVRRRKGKLGCAGVEEE